CEGSMCKVMVSRKQEQEKIAFHKLGEIMEAQNKELHKKIDTPLERAPQPPLPVIEYTNIYVLKKIPDFVGFDEKVYSLKEGSTVPIPTVNANALIKKGAVDLREPVPAQVPRN
ncbi:MAG TPA: hypothetical protein VKL21_05780, partial [Candidatus Methanoperedens sp.]|nr:hypothetical protein [Candidatus Methanoperedens sp.]